MRDYLSIANKIEILSLKNSDWITGMPLIIIGGIFVIVFVILGVSSTTEIDFRNKLKRITFSLIFLVLGGILELLGGLKLYSHQDYNNPKINEFLKKEGLENLNIEKFLSNVKKVKKYDEPIPDKFKHCSRYGCTYDTEGYQNAILNDFYNDNNKKEELFKQLEK